MENFQFLSLNCWFNKENSFKKATKIHALNGIVLNSILIVLLLALHSILLPELTHLLLVAIVFLTESFILLKRVNSNDGDGVFKMIKNGSISLAALDLLHGIISLVIIMYKRGESEMFTVNLIACIFNLTLTAVGVFGIWKRNTKLLSAYILYSYIQSLIIAYFLLVFFEIFQVPITIFIFPFLFIVFWMFFLIFFFVLHLNVINFTATNQPTPKAADTTGLPQV